MSVYMLSSECVYVSIRVYVSIFMSAQTCLYATSAEMCLCVLCRRKKKFHDKEHSLKFKAGTSQVHFLLNAAATAITKEVPSQIRAMLLCGTTYLVWRKEGGRHTFSLKERGGRRKW